MTCDPEAVDPLITVTIAGDDVEDVVLGPDCPEGDEGLWWNALVLPDFAYRYTQAPPSQWVPGTLLLAAVPDAATLTLGVAAIGTDTVTLESQKAILANALAQWPFTVTVAVGGTTVGSWRADPTIPRWGEMTQQDVGLFAAEAAVSITVQPTGAP